MVHDDCPWWLQEHESKWRTVPDSVDLYIVSEREDVGVQITVLGELFKVVLEAGDNGAVLPLDLIITFWMVRCRENILYFQDLDDFLKDP